jgi:hypothetical protein
MQKQDPHEGSLVDDFVKNQWFVEPSPVTGNLRLYRRRPRGREPARQFDRTERSFSGAIMEFLTEAEAFKWLEEKLFFESVGISQVFLYEVWLETGFDTGQSRFARRLLAGVHPESVFDFAAILQELRFPGQRWRGVSAKIATPESLTETTDAVKR